MIISSTKSTDSFMLRMKVRLRDRGLFRIKLYPDILACFSQMKKTHREFKIVCISMFNYFVSFSYNGVCFLRLIFNSALGQYQRAHSFWAKFYCAESNFLSLTLCSVISSTCIYEKYLKYNGDYSGNYCSLLINEN